MQHQNLKEIARIVFIRKFIAEILLNIDRENQVEKRIEIEKLKQKLFRSRISPEIVKEIKKPIFIPSRYSQALAKPSHALIKPMPLIKQPIQTSPEFHPKPYFQAPKYQLPPEIQPTPKQRPQGFSLGTLDILLKDPLIQSIECSGANQRILIKKSGQTNITQIILTENEIKQIIDTFSQYARIPAVRGILKAAVGDLIISSVSSEFAGSRFIINIMRPVFQEMPAQPNQYLSSQQLPEKRPETKFNQFQTSNNSYQPSRLPSFRR